ncbi:MAG: hypothetical protein ACOY0T_37145 [Myxococcota bacterium]
MQAFKRLTRAALIGAPLTLMLLAATPAPSFAQTRGKCIPAEECCRQCDQGKACGDSCISRKFTCRKGRGCACNIDEICDDAQ